MKNLLICLLFLSVNPNLALAVTCDQDLVMQKVLALNSVCASSKKVVVSYPSNRELLVKNRALCLEVGLLSITEGDNLQQVIERACGQFDYRNTDRNCFAIGLQILSECRK